MDEVTLVSKALELGIVGLMFVMWWLERKDRVTAERREDVFKSIVVRAENREEEVIGVIKENTKAITDLSGIIQRSGSQRVQ